MITIGSLFSGVGGLERGLEMAGLGPVRWQVEQDLFCLDVLAKHWPDAVKFGDIRHVSMDRLEPVDVVCGGFPCQPASVAGRRAGRSDTRWLWPEFARVLHGIRPRFLAIENVPGLLTVDRGAAFGTVLGDLATLGYDAWLDVLAAAEAGAPHKRDRLFVVAWLAHGLGIGHREQSKAVIEAWCSAQRSSLHVANAHSERQHQPQGRFEEQRGRSEDRGDGSAQPGLGRGLDGTADWLDGPWPAARGEEPYGWEPSRTEPKVPRRRERLKALGNAVVPHVACAIGHLIRTLAEATDAA